MKIVISDASSAVMGELVSRLVASGHSLVLVTREDAPVREHIPGVSLVSFETWEAKCVGFDVFLHFAVLTREKEGVSNDLTHLNGNFTASLASGARRSGISRFIYASTVETLVSERRSLHVRPEKLEIEAAEAGFGDGAEVIHLGHLHGVNFSGKFSFLGSLPRAIANFAFSVLSAVKPTTSVELLVRFLESAQLPGKTEPLIVTDSKASNYCYRVWQAALNGLFVAMVVVAMPILAIASVLVVLEDGAPAFFSQDRIGKAGAAFRCFKLRTMHRSAESRGTHLVPESAITGIGRSLRRFKIDELPQALNILRGEMSLIGPRPCLPSQHEIISKRESRGVLPLLPGLTGWAQANGVDMRTPDWLIRYDSQYLGLQSIWFDVIVLWRTVFPFRGLGGG